jgi:hypothetical protein
MPAQPPVSIKRISGGSVEVLSADGFSAATKLDEPFDCPAALAAQLLADGSGRFEEA